MAMPVSLADLRLDDFTPLVGEKFAIEYPDFQEVLELISAAPGRGTAPDGMRAPFSLIFVGERSDAMLNQQIHPIAHPAMGQQNLFMVPIGRNADGRFRYQVTFG